ncbi:hypothetical protein [Bdellovibrio sp. HCB337]|uniref:hypothetical protein n=1 Tax=Bdellovibrio sp. HCB337 TaxID=3394358 RepID=UPI0039A56EC3
MFKSLSLAIVLSFVSISTFAYSNSGNFPKGPDSALTPGALCEHPDSYRYPEKIAYCERDVSSDLKKEIFVNYDQLGYRTREMNRMAFKIDHYIPLCMGGSNSVKNLWPQHESVYQITDPLEPLLCEKMADGRISQKKAVEYIVEAKNNLDEVKRIIREVNQL